VAKVVPLLERIQATSCSSRATLARAGRAGASLSAAKERRNVFEAALTMLSLIELDRLEGVEPPSSW
jgi:hypothetical protein